MSLGISRFDRMRLLTLGINHRSASVELRERVAFAPEQMQEALVDARQVLDVGEVLILSTCNRTELVLVPTQGSHEASPESSGERIIEHGLDWMAAYHHLPLADLRNCVYSYVDREAMLHLAQVAAGLDSMVLGEPQILGQMKSAFAVARSAGTVGIEFSRLFPRLFALAKQVRTDTAIGENPVSVAYAAVDLAGHIFTDLSGATALLVGAGETIELVARHLANKGVSRIIVANRTLGHAREVAQLFNAEAVLLADIPEMLADSDIVISSTASQLPILGKGAVESALKVRKHRPILMIDLAVPRDIEPQVGKLSDVYLYSVDDLKDIVEVNVRARRHEARKADTIIEQGIDGYLSDLRALAVVDAVRAYRGNAEELRDRELAVALRLLERGEPADKVLTSFARGLTNKLIHTPSQELKRASSEGDVDTLHAARRLLGLDDQEQNPPINGGDEENAS